MIKRLIMIRHMDKVEPVPGALYGQTDLALKDGFEQKFSPLQKALELLKPDAVVCSPLKRCRQTVDFYFPDEKPIFKDEAMEVDFGDWDGLTFAQIKDKYPEEVNHWAEDEKFGFSNGETLQEFSDRLKVLTKFMLSLEGKNIVLVAHGGVIRMLLCQLLNLHQRHSSAFELNSGLMTSIKVFENHLGVLEKINDFGDETWLRSL
ncbi:MAG: histidine phosphatase family protein [Lentisphaeraceae bacterium]|nr:histidine phosphatase family protein [Lentisphaeraceae bacterium]